jgi:hypothetical protein
MKFEYINLEGNRAITDDVTLCPIFLEKVCGTYYEKAPIVKEKKIEKKTKTIEEVIEPQEVAEIVEPVENKDEAYLAFLKENKVR